MKFALMSPSKLFGFLLFASVVLVLAAPEASALPAFHVDGSGREEPWTNCTSCHGADLMGDLGPACTNCHNDFSAPDPPPVGHNLHPNHTDFDFTWRLDPFNEICSMCHLDEATGDLTGNIGPSCYSCHDQLWADADGGNGNGDSAPVVDAGGPYSGAPGETIQFDASGTVGDGQLIYLWAFGDGSTPTFPSQSPTITHVFESAGFYTGILTVTDAVHPPIMVEFTADIGGTGGNSPPTAQAGGPYAGETGQSVQLDASASSDPDGDTLTYSWDFGDGSTPTSPSSSASASHTYTIAGFFSAVVTVDDGVNTPVTDSSSVEIIVANLPPVAVAGGPYSGTAGQAVQFDASGSSDPDGDALSYVWDFGDGGLPTFPDAAAAATHTYQNPGTYTATVAVNDGVNTPASVDVTVEIAAANNGNGDGNGTPANIDAGDWLVEVPLAFGQLVVSFQPFAGILLVETTPTGGTTSFGIGMEFDGLIFWMDITGALFFGDIDHDSGTMWGIVFGYPGGSSPYFGERQP